jgi:formylglycine-generating enzyme required for sulfatase activity
MTMTRLLARTLFLVAIAATAQAANADGAHTTTVHVGAGTYRPLFPPSPREERIPVAAFELDKTPATNGEFLAFVAAHPEWRRDRIQPVFAEPTYLAQWASPLELGDGARVEQPVVNVSWYAARAYCASRGMRLPTEAEWEHAAAASRTSADGSNDAAWRAELMALYSRPNPETLARVGSSAPNFWGAEDMHGLVWEWVLDFGNATAAFSSGADRIRFCGAGAVGASDATDFAAFERVAFRTSLRANYTLKTLGFRCAR